MKSGSPSYNCRIEVEPHLIHTQSFAPIIITPHPTRLSPHCCHQRVRRRKLSPSLTPTVMATPSPFLILLFLVIVCASADDTWAPPGLACSMCDSCDNPCQPIPVPPPPPPAAVSNCPPPPSPPSIVTYNSPPPPSTYVYSSPPPPAGGSGGGGRETPSSNPPPAGGSYPTPPPPNPILPYFPFYYYSPPPPSKFVSGSGGLHPQLMLLFLACFIIFLL